ncbi:MAG: amidohydrolase [Bacillaceae bacterium]
MKTIWYNGNIYTLTEEGKKVESVVTEGTKIVAVGNYEQLVMNHTIDQYRDLKGNTMLPGLTDSHLHLIGHGENLKRLDLSRCTSMEQIIELLKAKVATTKHGEWIIGEGWNDSLFSHKTPFQLAEIDKITKVHPVLLKRICHHSAFANSLALSLADITNATPNPEGGRIGKDKNNELNGYLYDEAIYLLFPFMPQADEHYLQEALQLAIESCHRHGLVGVHTEDLAYYKDDQETLQAFQTIVEDGYKLKMNLLVNYKACHVLEQTWGENPYIEKGAMKIFADGSLGSRTALLSSSYSDDETTSGLAVVEPEGLNQLVQKARSLGMTVAIHTIGDLSLQYILDALEAYPPKEGQRDRIIHAEVMRADLFERMKHLPIVVDIQPVFISTGFKWMETRLGQERLAYTHIWKTMIEAGIVCAGGSDCPIETINPFVGMYCAITQQNAFFEKEGVFREEEKLSRFQAINLYTAGSAYAIYKEKERGKIAVGFDADFTIIDRDYFTCPEEELLQINVMQTVIDGEIVYKNSEKVS